MTAQISSLDSPSLNAGIAVPNCAPPSATVQYMNGSHCTMGICARHARLPVGGERFRPAAPSPAPVAPWQEAQFFSYTAAPRSTVWAVRGSGLLNEIGRAHV